MNFDAEALQQQIPYYLTADPAKKVLLAELKSLSEGAVQGYFTPSELDAHKGEMLQGDGWRGFQVFSFATGDRNRVRGIILSNSCDLSPENERVLPPKITFAPIIRLAKLEERFLDSGLKQEQIKSRLQAIRSQSITSMFYLPADDPLSTEYVALLDDLHSMPVEALREVSDKLFTLSMAGFYLYVFKLSVHFCRLQENIDRNPKIVAV
jgi:hypothetical protein